MRIISLDGSAPQEFTRLGAEEPLPATGACLITLTRFKAARAEILARQAPTGLILTSAERAHEIGADARHFALILLEFPGFRDGRGFSAARLLRERYHFTGEIRVAGAVLPDQALFLARCGVSSVELKEASRADAFRAALQEFTVAAQPARGDDALKAAPRLRPAGG